MQTRIRRTLIVVLAAVVVGAGLSAASASATYPGRNGKIAFVRYNELQNGEVHTVNPDGTGVQRLSNYDAHGGDSSFDRAPTWSRDGSKLAFRAEEGPEEVPTFHGVVVMNPDGSGRRNIGPRGLSPTWSPDSTQIAFSAWERGAFGVDFDLFKVNVDGTGLTRLASTPDVEHSPSWSPDGRIAFGRQEGYLWIMNSDGSNQTRLTTLGGGIQWSPDGSKIAYYDHGLHTVNPDGSNEREVGPGHQFSWSPDGHRLVLNSSVALYSVNADGSDLRQLTTGLSYSSVAWSPDGTKIVFSGDSFQESPGLFTMNADGSDVTRITTNPYGDSDYDVDWQPLTTPRPSDYKNASAYCVALRDFLGGADFSKRYKNHGKCVSASH